MPLRMFIVLSRYSLTVENSGVERETRRNGLKKTVLKDEKCNIIIYNERRPFKVWESETYETHAILNEFVSWTLACTRLSPDLESP